MVKSVAAVANRATSVGCVDFMRRSIFDTTKKTNTPKTSECGEGVLVRLNPPELARLDEWAAEQSDRPSRAEALRRLANKMLDLLEPPVMRERREKH